MRQLLTESVLLASVGGLLGLLFATEGLSLLKALLPADTPRLMDVRMDWRVLAFTGGLGDLDWACRWPCSGAAHSRGALTESLNPVGAARQVPCPSGYAADS